MDRQLISLLSTYPVACAVIFRLLNACCSGAFFQPDEYWQSLEVAHRLAHGYGFATWEWRTRKPAIPWDWQDVARTGGQGGIRSPLYPAIFVPLYCILDYLGIRNGPLLTLAPRLLQAIVAAAMDLSLRRTAQRILGPRSASVTLLCSLASFFHFHASTRTFSNSMETSLTVFAIEHWPWAWISEWTEDSKKERNSQREPNTDIARSYTFALSFAALATIMRPSNAVIWFLLGLHLLFNASRRNWGIIARRTVAVGFCASVFCFVTDSLFYGTPTFTPMRFLHSNVLQSISLFYGANASHFYFTQAIPILLLTQLPFALHGASMYFWQQKPRGGHPLGHKIMRTLGLTVMGTLACYTLLAHKEWRFIYPLLPILHLFAATSFVSRAQVATSALPIRRSHLFFVLSSLPLALYFTMLHCRGQTAVMAHLRTSLPPGSTVGFLMPCHSTPWQSALHRPDLEPSGYEGKMWFIGCEPPVLGQHAATCLDQSDIFYSDPVAYLQSHFPSATPRQNLDRTVNLPESLQEMGTLNDGSGYSHGWPSYLVVFGALLEHRTDGHTAQHRSTKSVADVLEAEGYVIQRRIWNGIGGWHEDPRRKGHVIVLEKIREGND